MKILFLLLFTISLLAGDLDALAGPLQCDRAQSVCFTNNRRLTIGDKVGVFTVRDELVAYGEVDRIQGEARRFKITKRHGEIQRGARIVRLEDGNLSRLDATYRIYKPRADRRYGGGAGISSYRVGDGLFTYAFEGLYEQHWRDGVHWVGRGYLARAAGTARSESPLYDSSEIEMNILGGLGGLSYTFFSHQPVQLRSELGLGLAYVSGAANGNSKEFGRTIERMRTGFGLMGRAEVAALYRYGQWQPGVYTSAAMVQSGLSNTIALMVLKDL